MDGDLDGLERILRQFINDGAKVHHYLLASASFPGQPAFTDALLKTVGGGEN